MTVLVAGATGRVGHFIVEQLRDAGVAVRALTRNAANADFGAGVEVVEGNLTQPETIAPLLEGVEAVHLINFDGATYTPLETGQELVQVMRESGVKRVTVLGAGENGPLESALEAQSPDGLAWTILQPVEFMTGALDFAPSIRSEGVVRQGFPNRRSAIVHEADIAAIAVAALTHEGHGGKKYVITGPEVLTAIQMVNIIGERLGREIPFIELSEAEARAQWAAEGFSEEVIEFFVWVQRDTPEVGYTVTDTVEKVTRKRARSFAQWLDESIGVFQKQEELATARI